MNTARDHAATAERAGPHHDAVRPASPEALRAPRRTWKDPRLWVGLVIVAVCVLLGARVLGSADDTVSVWSAAEDLPVGTAVTAELLTPVDLRFSSPEDARRYLSTGHRLPEGAVLERGVGAGELVPRAALGSGDGAELVEVPVALGADSVPVGLRAGEVVDVWVAPGADVGGTSEATKVLAEVRVTAVPRGGSTFGPTATRQVVVGVPATDDTVLAEALARIAAGRPVLVRRG